MSTNEHNMLWSRSALVVFIILVATLPGCSVQCGDQRYGASPPVYVQVANLDGQLSQATDANSLVTGNVASRYWTLQDSKGQGCKVAQNIASDGTYQDLVEINYDGAALFDGARTAAISLPTTATALTLSVPLQLPSGVASSTVYISIESVAGTVLASATYALTSSLVTTTITATGLTGGAEYRARIVTNLPGLGTSVQAKALVGHVTVTANSTSGMFSQPYFRLEVTPAVLWDASRTQMIGGKFWRTNPFSRVVLDTDAPTIGIEWETTSFAGDPLSTITIVVTVNGRPFASITKAPPSGSSNLDYLSLSELVLPSGPKRVEIYTSCAFNTDSIDVIYNPRGVFPRAIYTPLLRSRSQLEQQNRGGRRLLVLTDSISCGLGNPPCTLYAWPVQIRMGGRFDGAVATEGYGGMTFDEITSSPGVQQSEVEVISRFEPTDVLVNLGYNDWARQTMPVATFQTRITGFLNAVHAQNPKANIGWITLSAPTNSNAPNGNGDTPSSFRTATVNAVTGINAWWSYVLDGSNIYTDAQTVDHVHPNPLGVGAYSRFIEQALQAVLPYQVPGCVGDYDLGNASAASNNVTSIADRSSLASPLSQVSSLHPNAYTGNDAAWSGLPSMSGGGWGMIGSANTGLSGDALWTVIVGVNPGDTSSSGGAWGFGANPGGADAVMLGPSNAGAGVLGAIWTNNNFAKGTAYTTGAQIVTVRKKATGALSTTTVDIRRNGTAQALTFPGGTTTPTTTNTPFLLGAWQTGGNAPLPNNSTLAFASVFNRALADSEVQRLEHSLALQAQLSGI